MFILNSDRPTNSREEWQAGYTLYKAYLLSLNGVLPHAAYEFAAAPWHYDFSDSRSPHDGWLERLAVEELGTGERRQTRSATVLALLLGAYHDGHIELAYQGVSRLALTGSQIDQGHGDWLYDEVRLSADGRVEHEVEWSSGARWLIECRDIQYRWIPDAEQIVGPERGGRVL